MNEEFIKNLEKFEERIGKRLTRSKTPEELYEIKSDIEDKMDEAKIELTPSQYKKFVEYTVEPLQNRLDFIASIKQKEIARDIDRLAKCTSGNLAKEELDEAILAIRVDREQLIDLHYSIVNVLDFDLLNKCKKVEATLRAM